MAGDAAPEVELGVLLHSRAYLTLLAAAAVLGIPLSLIAFAFLAAVHELEHVVWHSLPESLGYDVPPAWWPIAALGLAGVLVALVVTCPRTAWAAGRRRPATCPVSSSRPAPASCSARWSVPRRR